MGGINEYVSFEFARPKPCLAYLAGAKKRGRCTIVLSAYLIILVIVFDQLSTDFHRTLAHRKCVVYDEKCHTRMTPNEIASYIARALSLS